MFLVVGVGCRCLHAGGADHVMLSERLIVVCLAADDDQRSADPVRRLLPRSFALLFQQTSDSVVFLAVEYPRQCFLFCFNQTCCQKEGIEHRLFRASVMHDFIIILYIHIMEHLYCLSA